MFIDEFAFCIIALFALPIPGACLIFAQIAALLPPQEKKRKETWMFIWYLWIPSIPLGDNFAFKVIFMTKKDLLKKGWKTIPFPGNFPSTPLMHFEKIYINEWGQRSKAPIKLIFMARPLHITLKETWTLATCSRFSAGKKITGFMWFFWPRFIKT